MILEKRDCPIKMEIVPDAGWIDVYLSIGNEQLYFHISYVFSSFNYLLRALYYLYPKSNEPNYYDDNIEYKVAIENKETGEVKIYDVSNKPTPPYFCSYIPWKAHYKWDEEGAYSQWELERESDEAADFMLKLNIGFYRQYAVETDFEEHFEEVERHVYEVRYKDLCYAVAKACTDAIKKYGFYGYQYSSYGDDLNLRFVLFLKAVALDCLEVRELIFHEDGKGQSSNFDKEMELLLFNM